MRGKRILRKLNKQQGWKLRVVVISIAMLLPLITSLTSYLSPLTSFMNAQGVQTGKASFYAMKFSGRKTASGERLHHDSLTWAHRTYPFGTQLKVTNPSNGKSVIVRVTDRGPYVKGRIIDLSVRAARELGIISQGIAPVIVERYNPSIIPFKPEDVIELPELELSTNEGPITKPIWVELKEQQEQKNKSQKAVPVINRKFPPPPPEKKEEPKDAKAPEVKAPETTAPQTPQKNRNGIDEINKKPNQSKAYQKREEGSEKKSRR